MKAVLVTKEFSVNGIKYYPNTFVSKANLIKIAEFNEFLNYDEDIAWWSSFIESVKDKYIDAFIKKMNILFNEYSILYYQICTID